MEVTPGGRWLSRLVRVCAMGAAFCGAIGVGALAPAQEPARPANPAASRQYAAAAALQNREQYELAAEEWAKFLEKFAADARADRAQHYLGICNLKLKQFAPAAAAQFSNTNPPN